MAQPLVETPSCRTTRVQTALNELSSHRDVRDGEVQRKRSVQIDKEVWLGSAAYVIDGDAGREFAQYETVNLNIEDREVSNDSLHAALTGERKGALSNNLVKTIKEVRVIH